MLNSLKSGVVQSARRIRIGCQTKQARSARHFSARKPCQQSHQRTFCSSSNTQANTTPASEDVPLTHQEVVDLLLENGVIKNQKVLNAAWQINPHLFSRNNPDFPSDYIEPEPGSEHGDEVTQHDTSGKYTSEEWAASMVAFILTLEGFADHLKSGMRVLDIGSGTGFVSAALAHLVFPRGEVIALDTDPAMLEYARKRLDKYHPQLSDMIQLIEHNGWTGYKNFAPYDAIHVGAAIRGPPRMEWIDQLKLGGVLIGSFVETDSSTGEETEWLKKFVKTERGLLASNILEVDYEELKSPTKPDLTAVPTDEFVVVQ